MNQIIIPNEYCRGCKHYKKCKEITDINMPYKENPVMASENDDNNIETMEKMYPKIYYKVYPMVRSECDRMEEKHGKHHCPSKDELEDICDKIYNKMGMDDKYDDDDDDERDDYYRQRRRRYGRRRAVKDLIGILLLRELIGRRRRRPPQHYGY